MQPYLPLILGFLVAFGIAALIYWPCAQLRTKKKLVSNLWGNQRSLSDTKRALRHGPAYWFLLILLSSAVTAGLGLVFYQYLARWIFQDLVGGMLQNILQKIQNAWLTEIFSTQIANSSDTETRIVPYGVLLAVFLGLMIGAYCGSVLGRKRTCRKYLLSSRFY